MAIYPFYKAGQRLTAADLIAAQELIVFKAVNTDRTSTITFTDDPELTLQLAANAVYTVEFFIGFAGGSGKFQSKWTVPSGATGNKSVQGPGSLATDTSMDNASMRSGVFPYSTAIAYGNRTTSSTNQSIAIETSLITTTTAGTCALSWTQVTSNVAATRVGAGSWVRALRIA